MRRDTPPLPWLLAFESASRHRNFTLAAEELGLTPAAVSYQVRALEEVLGYRLFVRKSRPMALTTMGELYQPWVNRAFSMIAQGTADVFGASIGRPVRVRCPQSFAMLWLVPRLPMFRAQHPDIVLQLHMATWAGTIDREMLDLDIAYGDGSWAEGSPELLVQSPIVPVCTPALRSNGGDVQSLANSDLIEVIGVPDTWRQFFFEEGARYEDREPALQVDQSLAALELAVLGLGHALVLELYAAPYLADGRLVPSLAKKKHSDQALYVLQPDGVQNHDCTIFREWLLTEISKPG